MKNRISTNEETDFCGCVFAISFIRESPFQKPLLQAIHKGFEEWVEITSQINSYRGIRSARLHRTLVMVLREIGFHTFGTRQCCTLHEYFDLCSQNETDYYRGMSMQVKKKQPDLSFSGMLSGLSISLPKSKSSSSAITDRGSSEDFLGNAISHTHSVQNNTYFRETSLETIHESDVYSSTLPRDRPLSPSPFVGSVWSVHGDPISPSMRVDHSPSMMLGANADDDIGSEWSTEGSDDTDACRRAYRRQSVCGKLSPSLIPHDDMGSEGSTDGSEDTDACRRAYRRQSVCGKLSPSLIPQSRDDFVYEDVMRYNTLNTIIRGDRKEEMEVIECESIMGSQLGSQICVDERDVCFSPSANSSSQENILKFEVLNPSLFLWTPIYEYVEKNFTTQGNGTKFNEDWFELLIRNGNVYIAFVNNFHQYVSSIGKGDIVWSKVPGYADICITIPLMVMECRYQNRANKEDAFYQQDLQAIDLSSIYPASCFRLKNVSSDSHPILRSLRILPKYNPRITYACLEALFNSSNVLLPKDVTAYLSRSTEVIRSLHQARLSYYANAIQRCQDESLSSNVIEANVEDTPRTLVSPVVNSQSLHKRSKSSTLNLLKTYFTSSKRKVADHGKMVSSSSAPSLVKLATSRVNLRHEDPHIIAENNSPIADLVDTDFPLSITGSPSLLKQATGFHEQVEGSLFNISRVVTLLALQFHEAMKIDHKDILTSVVATIYELPTIISEGDFHIFINTALFCNSKYVNRYDVSLTLNSLSQSHTFVFPRHTPNVLCRLFCHWCTDVQDYIHQLLVFRIIMRNMKGLTELQKLMINAYKESAVNHDLCVIASIQRDNSDGYSGHEIATDYEMIGREIFEYLCSEGVTEILNSQCDALSSRKYGDYSTRLSMEMDIVLFSLFSQQYDQDYYMMYQEPTFSYMMHSLGRFAELLFRAYTNPENTTAPALLNMVFSEYGVGQNW